MTTKSQFMILWGTIAVSSGTQTQNYHAARCVPEWAYSSCGVCTREGSPLTRVMVITSILTRLMGGMSVFAYPVYAMRRKVKGLA